MPPRRGFFFEIRVLEISRSYLYNNCKSTYIMRTSPEYADSIITRLHHHILTAVRDVLRLKQTATSTQLLQLPIRNKFAGGAGFINLQIVAPIARKCGEQEVNTKRQQKKLYVEEIYRRTPGIVTSMDSKQKVLVASAAHPAAARLYACDKIKHTIAGFRAIMAIRLTTDFIEWSTKVCRCGKAVTLYHNLSCVKWSSATWKLRHDMVKSALATELLNAGGVFTLETRLKRTNQENNDRPDLHGYLGHRMIAIDVSIRSPTAVKEKTYLAAAYNAEREKDSKYKAACSELGYEFYPFILEVSGALGPKAADLINIISHHGLVDDEKIKNRETRIFTAIFSAMSLGQGLWADNRKW